MCKGKKKYCRKLPRYSSDTNKHGKAVPHSLPSLSLGDLSLQDAQEN